MYEVIRITDDGSNKKSTHSLKFKTIKEAQKELQK